MLEILGLKNDVFWMIERVGWITFVNTKYPTCIKPTLEFLSLIEASVIRIVSGAERVRSEATREVRSRVSQERGDLRSQEQSESEAK